MGTTPKAIKRQLFRHFVLYTRDIFTYVLKKRPGIMRLSVVVIALVVAVAVGTEGRRLHSKRITVDDLTEEQKYTELKKGFFGTSSAPELYAAADDAGVSTIEGLCTLVSSETFEVADGEASTLMMIKLAYCS